MKNIFKEFMRGDSAKKLSIMADFATILGVSIATFVAGPFLSTFADIEFIIADFVLAIAFYFLCLYFLYEIISLNIRLVADAAKQKKYRAVIKNIILFLIMLWFTVTIFPYFKNVVGYGFNVSYLLPLPSSQAITNVSDLKIEKVGEVLRCSGNVNFKNNAKAKNYVVMVYYQSKKGLYEIATFEDFYNSDYEAKISNSGSFSFPVSILENSAGGVYIVIYRNSDKSIIGTYGTIALEKGYPNKLTQLPHTDTDDLGVFVQKINTINELG